MQTWHRRGVLQIEQRRTFLEASYYLRSFGGYGG
jgi:hypothetical protein